MIVVVFRSRIQPAAEEAYREAAQTIVPTAMEVPGYLSHKVFSAEDGERVTIVEYASEDAMKVWGRDPRHVEVKKLGRQSFYSEYKVQVCNLIREKSFSREAAEART
jgi:heme-degrading monooxygenase HmoA